MRGLSSIAIRADGVADGLADGLAGGVADGLLDPPAGEEVDARRLVVDEVPGVAIVCDPVEFGFVGFGSVPAVGTVLSTGAFDEACLLVGSVLPDSVFAGSVLFMPVVFGPAVFATIFIPFAVVLWVCPTRIPHVLQGNSSDEPNPVVSVRGAFCSETTRLSAI
jgi:hypothetical protein